MEFKAKIVSENQFEPLGADDFKLSIKLEIGDFVSIKKWKERNVDFHRKYFALLKTTIHFLDEDEKYDKLRNINYLRKELMIMIGEVDIHISMDGTMHMTPKSISFERMDDVEFSHIYNLSVDKILKHYLKHLSYDQFEKYIMEFI